LETIRGTIHRERSTKEKSGIAKQNKRNRIFVYSSETVTRRKEESECARAMSIDARLATDDVWLVSKTIKDTRRVWRNNEIVRESRGKSIIGGNFPGGKERRLLQVNFYETGAMEDLCS